MKKKYLLLLLVLTGFTTFSQEFTIDFEGTNPLNNLPAGVTSINAPDSTQVYIAKDGYYVNSLGGDIVLVPTEGGELVKRDPQFENTIVTDNDTSSSVLQADYTGHLVIDETALGTGDFTVRLDYKLFGHSMGSSPCALFTITGSDAGTWSADRVVARNGGFTDGLGLAGFGNVDTGFPYGKVLPVFNDVVLTYTSSDQLYRFYRNGVLVSTSIEAQTSGAWSSRKIYLSFTGGAQNPIDGEFTEVARRGDGRNLDLQTRMDNVQVFKRAISDADVTTLFNGGSLLSTTNSEQDLFKAFPNPVKNLLHFSSSNIASVEVFNILGAKVISQNNANAVDMSNLKAGVYFLKIKGSDSNINKILKVVKE